MTDPRSLDDEIRSAFVWLMERVPPGRDLGAGALADLERPRGERVPAALRNPALAAVVTLLLVGVPLALWSVLSRPATESPSTRNEFVTSIPAGETLLGATAEWEVFGFLTEGGLPCIRVAPVVDRSYCSSPGIWAIPGILNWGATWGVSPDGWVYGLVRPDVTRIDIEFQFAAVEQATLLPAASDLGWGAYVHRFDADVNGLFTVITAYASDGSVIGQFDSRSECPVEHDERLRSLCSSP